MSISKRKIFLLTIILLIIIGIIMRLWNLIDFGLWRDEAFSVNLAQESVKRIIDVVAKDTQPPLHVLFLHYWGKIFGYSEISMRLPSLILTTASLWFWKKILKFGANHDNPVRAGRDLHVPLFPLFIAFFFINPIIIFYSTEARVYGMLIFFFSGALYYFLKIYESKFDKSNGLGYILFSVLCLYSQNLYVLTVITFFLLFTFKIYKNSKFKIQNVLKNKQFFEFGFLNFVLFLIYLPWVAVVISQMAKLKDDGFWLVFKPIIGIFTNTAASFVGHEFNYNVHLWDGVFIGISAVSATTLFAIGVYKELVGKSATRTFKLSFLLIINFVILWLLSFFSPFFFVRYFIYLVPVMMVLVINAATLNKSTLRLLFIYFIAVICFQMLNFYPSTVKGHYKEVINDIEKQINQNNTEVILNADTYTFHSTRYYVNSKNYLFDPKKEDPFYFGTASLVESDYFDVNAFNEYKRIWIIHWKKNLDDDLLFELKKNGFELTKKDGKDKLFVFEYQRK